MACRVDVDMAAGILNENGVNAVPLLKSIGLPFSKDCLSDIRDLDREIRDFMDANGIKNRLPTNMELRYGNRRDLVIAIRKQGGIAKIAMRIGLKYIRQKRLSVEQYSDFQRTVRHIKEFIDNHGLDGRMPLYRELRREGETQLSKEILQFGGFQYVADWMEVRYDPHPINERNYLSEHCLQED